MLDGDEPEPLRGAAARTVENMEASLSVPTATSVRAVPAKLLEVNRQILNNQLARTGAGKVSFTHLIAFAVLRALADFPALNSAFADGGRQARRRAPPAREPRARGRRPATRRHAHAARARTSRTPTTLDFAGFCARVRGAHPKVRGGKISPDDFAGTTVHDHEPRA